MIRRLRTRRDEPGALVLLADGRLAVTGDGVVATGGQRQLFRYCRERIRRADTAAGAGLVAGGGRRGQSGGAGVSANSSGSPTGSRGFSSAERL